jgi:hypothetical protein
VIDCSPARSTDPAGAAVTPKQSNTRPKFRVVDLHYVLAELPASAQPALAERLQPNGELESLRVNLCSKKHIPNLDERRYHSVSCQNHCETVLVPICHEYD